MVTSCLTNFAAFAAPSKDPAQTLISRDEENCSVTSSVGFFVPYTIQAERIGTWHGFRVTRGSLWRPSHLISLLSLSCCRHAEVQTHLSRERFHWVTEGYTFLLPLISRFKSASALHQESFTSHCEPDIKVFLEVFSFFLFFCTNPYSRQWIFLMKMV